LLWAVSAAAETPRQADAEGLRLVVEKRWEEAEARYEAAVERFPDYVPLRRNLANLYVLGKQYDKAVSALQRAVVLDPAHEGTWRLLREMMLSTGRPGAWVPWAARWNRTARTDAAFRALVGAHLRAGHLSQARALARSRPALREALEGPPLPAPSPSLKRLVLLVTLDTFRADCLDPDLTPALWALAGRSHRFSDCTAVAPITLPAHASLLTGLYPNHTGVRDNSVYRLAPEAPTLAEAFKAAGWETGAFVSAYILDRRFGLDQGFDAYGDRFAPAEAGGRFPESRPAGETLAEAARWLAGRKGDRAFLWVHLYDTHAPYEPPFPFDQAWPERPFRGEAAALDHALGRFLGPLMASRLWAGTLVAVVGDHGESLGEHGEATHGFLLYQATLHVPLLLRLPGQAAGADHPVPVSQVDLYPTLLEWLAVPAPAHDGEPLLKAGPGRVLYSETQIPLPFRWSDLYRARRGGWTFTAPPAGRWHDLERDPREQDPVPAPPAAEAGGRPLDLLVAAYRAEAPRFGAGAGAALDEEAMARLRSLGYAHVGGASARPDVGGLPDPEGKMEALTLYQRALEAEEKGDLGALAHRARELAAAEADNPAMLAFAAEWLNRAGDAGGAMKLVARALELDPRYAQALFYRGYLREGRGDPAGAASDYAAALREQPGHFLARYNLSRLFLVKGEWARAEGEIRAILERLPNHAYTLNNWAYLKMKRDRDCAGALELAQRAFTLKPGDPVLKESVASIEKACRNK
jgi:arylsulfatase A-like enzyme/predicted Zn-dependent protease